MNFDTPPKVWYEVHPVTESPTCDFLRKQGVKEGFAVWKVGKGQPMLGEFICVTHDRVMADVIAGLLTMALRGEEKS